MTVCIAGRALIHGELVPLSIIVEEGMVIDVKKGCSCPGGASQISFRRKGLVMMPGFLDLHVHLRGLGYSYKEDERSGTEAAAAAGYTGVVDMPNTYPRINTGEALEAKIRAFRSKALVNYGVHLGLPPRRHAARLLSRPEVMGLKIYPNDFYSLDDVAWAAGIASSLGKPVVVHCEHPDMIREGCEPGYRWKCRSLAAETACINLLSRILPGKTRIHITHATTPSLVYAARRKGFTVDTCPHYFMLSSEDEARLRCLAKVNPPLRPRSLAEAMQRLVVSGLLDAVASDHAPHASKEKGLGFDACPAGIVGLEAHSRIMLDLAVRGLLSLELLSRLMSKGHARILGLGKYGCFEKGCMASYTVVDLKGEGVIKPEFFHSKARYTPFDGYRYKGEITATIVNGLPVYLEGDILPENASPLPLGDMRCASKRRLWAFASRTH